MGGGGMGGGGMGGGGMGGGYDGGAQGSGRGGSGELNLTSCVMNKSVITLTPPLGLHAGSL